MQLAGVTSGACPATIYAETAAMPVDLRSPAEPRPAPSDVAGGGLPLVFRPAAQAEFDESAVWYEARRSGLGIEIVAEVQRTLDDVTHDAKRFAVVFGDVREARVNAMRGREARKAIAPTVRLGHDAVEL
jgi:hypothetical protein